jgi:hypothetical protein
VVEEILDPGLEANDGPVPLLMVMSGKTLNAFEEKLA